MTSENTKVKPITPADIGERVFPDQVILTWNELIKQNFLNGRAVFSQTLVVHRLACSMCVGSDLVYRKGWLDIEELYKKAGWNVEYSKPGYNETGNATFKFTPSDSFKKD